MGLLEVIQHEGAERERRAEAEARECCDYCGEPFRRGHIGNGGGRGWGKQRITVQAEGRWWVVCSWRCQQLLTRWHWYGKGRVPRLIGRETVAAVKGG